MDGDGGEMGHPANGRRDPLDHPEWAYVGPVAPEDLSAADFAPLDSRRAVYYRERQATEILRMLQASENDPTFDYHINNFRRCLQSATMALRAAQPWTGTSARNGASTRPSSARWSSSPCSTRTPWIPITIFCR